MKHFLAIWGAIQFTAGYWYREFMYRYEACKEMQANCNHQFKITSVYLTQGRVRSEQYQVKICQICKYQEPYEDKDSK